MDMSSLFPTEGGIGSVMTARPTPHISFKAGILNRDVTSDMVTADPRKGIFQIITSPEDGLLHLQWRAKIDSTVDHDLILFNAETEMKLVTSCPASARVYVLKWREADTRMFFWMQGKNPAEDAQLIVRVNNILENGPDSQQAPNSAETSREARAVSVNHPNATEVDVVMQPQSAPPELSATPTEPLPAPSTRGQITLEQMRQALQSRSTANPSTAEAQRELVLTTPTIVDLLCPDAVRTALADSRVQEALPDLFQHLPEQDRSMHAIEQVLRSPPLRTQAAVLSQALQQSTQPAELLRSFELPTPTAAGEYGLLALLDALLTLEQQSKDRQE